MQVGNDDEWASLAVSCREWDWARSCGIKKDGSLWCWSTLVRGLDDADEEFSVRSIVWLSLGIKWFDRGRPVRVDESANWANVATGRHGYVGVTKEGNVARWIEGQRPVSDFASGKVKQVSVGESVAYMVSPLGEIRASSDGAASLAVIPSQAASTSWTKISVGGDSHVCGIQKSGVLSCWGTAHPYGSTMQTFGNPSHRWKDVAAGHEHTCAVRQDGTVWCWGSNGDGALGTGDFKNPGNGTTDPFSVLVRVGQESDFVQVVSGRAHSCARRENGRIVCWGYMGSDDLAPRFAP
jgi:alpha-tubulin suppressor-like RCC1 family protein